MRRGLLLWGIAGVTTVVLGLPTAALAGGGCHSAATQDDATGQDETTVSMIDACFTASVTTVDPGTSVTFVNRDDGLTHNVGGNLWGYYGDMAPGDAFTAVFDDPGVYPFACSYHPGMTGAIVVGDGFGVGDGWTVRSTLPEHVEDPAQRPVVDRSSTAWIVVAGVAGIAIGGALTGALLRLRRTTAA